MRTLRSPTRTSVAGDAMRAPYRPYRHPFGIYSGTVRTDEDYDDEDEPRPRAPYVDGAWGRTANPNTVDGELQNLAAFGAGLTRLSGPKRTAARIVVLLILVGLAIGLVYGIVGVVRGG
jgi:hypothetical protein